MEFVYVGIKGYVIALRKSSGAIVWKTSLASGSSFVPIVQEGDRLFAGSGGEVTCLDCETGKERWHNPLKGYGSGFLALAGGGFPTSAAAAQQMAAQVATTAAIIAATSG